MTTYKKNEITKSTNYGAEIPKMRKVPISEDSSDKVVDRSSNPQNIDESQTIKSKQ